MGLRLLPVFVALLILGVHPVQAPVLAQSDDIDNYMARGRELAKAGKLDQALPYFMLSLELAEARLGPKDPGIVPILDDLAGAYASRKNYGDAEPLYKRALEIQERAAQRYQTGIVRTLNNLGAIYEATDRAGEAMALYRRVLTTWASVLGSDHPDVQVAGGRLAKLALRAPKAPPEEAPPAPVPEPKIAEAPAERPPPKPPRAKPPPPAARDGPRYAIHLTSIRNPRDALAEWDRLRRLYGSLLKGLELRVSRVDLGPPRGVYYRIKGGPLTRKAARARCAPFKARDIWCDVKRVGKPPEAPMVATRERAAAPKPPVEREARKDGYLIHLTSIRKPEDAEAEWHRLKRIYGKLLAGLELTVRRADLGPRRGIYYRIEGGPLTRTAARKLCAEFSARKVWCRIVRPGEEAARGPSRLALRRVRRRPPTRPRGTRRLRAPLSLRTRRRDRGCRRSPFALPPLILMPTDR